MAQNQEDEWEYEYDENETEDFYITLDVSNVPPDGTSGAPEFDSIHPRLASRPLHLHSKLRQTLVRRPAEDVTDPIDTEENQSTGEMQIINLHTQNPLVVYNDQLLSCKWASTIGTDMFFVKSESGTDAGERPLRSLPAVDLLAMSSTKLVAKAARLRPRDDILEGFQAQKESGAVETSGSLPTDDGPQESSDFLAKLNEAKAKRGEKSRLEVLRNPDGSSSVIATMPQRKSPKTRQKAVSEDVEMEED